MQGGLLQRAFSSHYFGGELCFSKQLLDGWQKSTAVLPVPSTKSSLTDAKVRADLSGQGQTGLPSLHSPGREPGAGKKPS